MTKVWQSLSAHVEVIAICACGYVCRSSCLVRNVTSMSVCAPYAPLILVASVGGRDHDRLRNSGPLFLELKFQREELQKVLQRDDSYQCAALNHHESADTRAHHKRKRLQGVGICDNGIFV